MDLDLRFLLTQVTIMSSSLEFTSRCWFLESSIHKWSSPVRQQQPVWALLCRNPARQSKCQSSPRNTSCRGKIVFLKDNCSPGSSGYKHCCERVVPPPLVCYVQGQNSAFVFISTHVGHVGGNCNSEHKVHNTLSWITTTHITFIYRLNKDTETNSFTGHTGKWLNCSSFK